MLENVTKYSSTAGPRLTKELKLKIFATVVVLAVLYVVVF